MYTKTQQQQLIQRSRGLLDSDDGLSPEQEVKALREVLHFHDWRYYVLHDPVLSDYEYDRLFKQLKTLEQEHPELQSADSPTRRVASELTKEFPEVRHLRPMLSLDNSYSLEDLQDFDRRVKQLAGRDKVDYAVEPKFDGTGISLIFEDDRFVRGATRGNGVTGEEITNNLRVMRTIPLLARFSEFGLRKVEIRGEVLISKSRFKKLNEARMEEGQTPFANPRNAAAGSLRLQDAQEVNRRGLEAILYHISYAEDKDGNDALGTQLTSHAENVKLLHRLGFKTPLDNSGRFHQMEEVLQFCRRCEEKRDELPYELDGMVIKVDKLELYDKLGATAHHPRWAMAYKFKARQVTTRLKDVIFNVGRTGAVTPVAKLKPVQVGGVTVSSVSMFNEDFVREKDIRVGDTVLVERAGDVIPYIVKPVTDARDGSEKPVKWPKQCPSCDSPIQKTEGEVAWRCNNINCEAQVLERLIHFVSKSAMNIDGVGESIVRKLYAEGLVRRIPDLYRLDYDKIRGWEGFAEKSVENMQAAIGASKQQPLHRLLFALGIRHVGAATARMLTKKVTCLTDLKDWRTEQLLALRDVGPIVAESIAAFFRQPQNLEMVEALRTLGLKVCKDAAEASGKGPMQGATFVFTGTLDHFTRDEAKAKVEALGGEVRGSVSSRITYLVAGSSPGSKLDKARKLGTVKVLDEAAFRNLLNGQ